MLGIIIGVGAVIAMVGVGQGAQQQVQQQIAAMAIFRSLPGARSSFATGKFVEMSFWVNRQTASQVLKTLPAEED